MNKLIIILFIISSSVYSQSVYYVAIDGNDSNSGSMTEPWATWQKAFNEAEPGDTVYFRGGVYMSTERNTIDPEAWPSGIGVSGTRENPIHYFGYPGEWPILDCSLHCDYAPNGGDDFYNSAISLNAVEYIHFKDFEIRNVFQCDSVVTGAIATSWAANLTFEHIIMHSIGQRGYWINGGAWGEHTQDPEPMWDYDTTRWINCDVYDLADTLSSSPGGAPGNAADAWKTIHYKGNVVIWEGCRAWNYSDDGWDPTPVDGAERILNNCWAMASNKFANISEEWEIERNAFKFNSHHPDEEGSSFERNSIVVKNCLAVFSSAGFGEIGQTPANGIYYNNTSYKNTSGFVGTWEVCNSEYKNNLVYGSISETYFVQIYNTNYEESHNTWTKSGENAPWPGWEYNYDVWPVNENDFVTVDSLELVALFTAPRKPDGSLPPFPLKLAAGSDLIDAGIDVGLPFNGAAPDIGAFEYAAPATSRGKGSSAGGGKLYIRNGKIYVR